MKIITLEELSESIKLFLGTLAIPVVAFAFIGVFLSGMQFVKITFFDNIPSVVYVDNKEIYRGSSAGFNTESNGYATKVTIYDGFLYFFPQKVYVHKDVRIVGEKNENRSRQKP